MDSLIASIEMNISKEGISNFKIKEKSKDKWKNYKKGKTTNNFNT